MKNILLTLLSLCCAVGNVGAGDKSTNVLIPNSIMESMKISSSDSTTNNGWDSLSKIKGVKWKWSIYDSGKHDNSIVGTTKIGKSKNPNIGNANVSVYGSRNMINIIKIEISNESLQEKDFGIGKTIKIKTDCDDDSFTNSVGFYRYEQNGYKPVYVSYQVSSGAGGSSSSEYSISYDLDDALTSYSNSCKPL